MHSTTRNALLISLLPFLGVEATRYRGSGGGGGPLQDFMLASSNMQAAPGGGHYGGGQPDSGCSGTGAGNAGRNKGCNDCGISSFVETTQSTNPLVSDCEAMLQKIQKDQEWIINSQGVTIVTHGSCAFTATTQGDTFAKLGNADVLDLVQDAIKQFGSGGTVGCHGGYNLYVGSAGVMPCDSLQPGGEQVRVDWTLGPSGKQGGGGGNGIGGGGSWPGQNGGSGSGWPSNNNNGMSPYDQQQGNGGGWPSQSLQGKQPPKGQNQGGWQNENGRDNMVSGHYKSFKW